MSIREIARTLYQLKRRLEELERACQAERQQELELELKRVRAEYNRVKNILDGAKEASSLPNRAR